MSAFNTVTAKAKCPSCNNEVIAQVQFKYGKTRQINYQLGDFLQWGGNDIGMRGKHHVVVDGAIETECRKCRRGEWNVYVHIQENSIVLVENADGRFDFSKAGMNYIVLD